MSAGLPGLGLGGIFFILSALVAPLFEAARMASGRSSRERRRQVARQFLLAVAMLIAIDLTLRGVLTAGYLLGAAPAPHLGLIALPLAPIGITTALLALVVAGAKCAELALRPRRRREPQRAEGRARIGELSPDPR
jgi:hypothetical protein